MTAPGRSRTRALAPGIGLLALVGCRPAPPSEVLPDALAVVAMVDAGDPEGPEPVSLLVTLPRPGVEPAVRLQPGITAMDLGFAAVVEHRPDGALSLSRLDPDGGSWRGTVEPGAALIRVDRDGVVIDESSGQLRLDWDGRRAALAAPLDGLGGQATHPGPAGGFEALLEGDELFIALPRERGEPVLDQVEAVLGCWWLRMADLPPWQRRVVDDAFKQVAMLQLSPGRASLDGDLGEWSDATAVRVDEPGQLLAGQAGWRGSRDAGFGVAARQDAEGRLILGVRIRDDRHVAGQEHLVLQHGTVEHRIALVADGGLQDGDGMQAVVGPRSGREQAVEIVLDGLSPAQVGELIVRMVDVDPDQDEITILATAPGAAALRLGQRVHRPDAPARRPGR